MLLGFVGGFVPSGGAICTAFRSDWMNLRLDKGGCLRRLDWVPGYSSGLVCVRALGLGFVVC